MEDSGDQRFDLVQMESALMNDDRVFGTFAVKESRDSSEAIFTIWIQIKQENRNMNGTGTTRERERRSHT